MGAKLWSEKKPLLQVHPVARAAVILLTWSGILVGAGIQFRVLTIGF